MQRPRPVVPEDHCPWQGPIRRRTEEPEVPPDELSAAHARRLPVMDDGQETESGPGDFAVIPPGHDAWIVGDQSCVVIDWQGFAGGHALFGLAGKVLSPRIRDRGRPP